MGVLDNLKFDTWWKIVLGAGVATVFASLSVKVDFLDEKHLFGSGIGLFLIGLSHYMADKTANEMMAGGILSYKVIKHNLWSVLVLILGFAALIYFGYKIAFQIL